MEYERTEDHQMQADFARRIGQVLLQYEQRTKGLPAEERYEATLNLALLQALLTLCAELLKRRSSTDETGLVALAKRSLNADPTVLGLERSCVVKQWPSTRPLMYREIIECLRHSMSHPNMQTDGQLSRTGYTSWQSPSGVIEGFTFTQSPWVNAKGRDLNHHWKPKASNGDGVANLRRQMEIFSSNYEVPELEAREDGAGRFRVFRRGERFVPVLQLKLSTSQLRMLTHNLSDHLAAPVAAQERHFLNT